MVVTKLPNHLSEDQPLWIVMPETFSINSLPDVEPNDPLSQSFPAVPSRVSLVAVPLMVAMGYDPGTLI